MHWLRAITVLLLSTLEKTNSLKQLRWLENGYRIVAHVGFRNGEYRHPENPVKAKRFLVSHPEFNR